jgi:hypothetical protein
MHICRCSHFGIKFIKLPLSLFLACHATVLQSIHSYLYLNQGIAITAEHEALYSNPSITVYSISPLTSFTGAVSYSYSVQVISLIEAIQAVIDKARAVSLLSPAQVTLSDPDVFFLIKNAPEAIFQTLNQSSALYVQAVHKQVHHFVILFLSHLFI